MKLIFCLKISRKVFNKLIVLLLGVHSHACPKYPNQQVCSISRKTLRMKLIFCLKIKMKGFFKLILLLQVCVASHVPKLAKVTSLLFLCNILKKRGMTLLFCMQHESLIEIDAMILMELAKYSQSILGSNLQRLYNIFKKKLEMKLIFCMQININFLAFRF